MNYFSAGKGAEGPDAFFCVRLLRRGRLFGHVNARRFPFSHPPEEDPQDVPPVLGYLTLQLDTFLTAHPAEFVPFFRGRCDGARTPRILFQSPLLTPG